MDTLSYFQSSDSAWKKQCHNNPKWSAPSPTQSSALETYSNTSPSLSFSESSVFSSFVSQQDLLPELWLETPKAQNHVYSNSINGGSVNNSFATYNNANFTNQDVQDHLFQPHCDNVSSYSSWNSKPRSNPPPGLAATAVLRDSSLEYAQSLLPHSLLMPLTQENLDYHKGSKPVAYNDMYVFDRQVSMEHDQLPTINKERNGSVSSTSSSSAHSSHSGQSCLSKTPKTNAKSLNTQLYKTELCMLYMKTNVCPYGSKCQFAHGEIELKRVERPSNWRSKPCANWMRYSLCRYGKRCCFKHGE